MNSKATAKLTLNKETVARLSLKSGIKTGPAIETTQASRINGGTDVAGCATGPAQTDGPILPKGPATTRIDFGQKQ